MDVECVSVTHSEQMRFRLFPALVLSAVSLFGQQSSDEDFKVYADHPRLLLKAQRLRLLKREVERKTMRWLQLETLWVGKAQMAEPGFAAALFYSASGNADAAKQAIAWATGLGTDTHQLALVFDWCEPAMSEAQKKQIAAKLKAAIEQSARANDIPTVRSRVYAAIALADYGGYDATDLL